jgi:hypothetical protein
VSIFFRLIFFMSGFTVLRDAISVEDRVEILTELVRCIKSGDSKPTGYVYAMPFEGRIAELVRKQFANVVNPEAGTFDDHTVNCLRIFAGDAPKVTPTHYDPYTVVFTLNLFGHKKWHTQKAGLDALWQTPPVYRNQVKTITYWKQADHVYGGDISMMPLYVYHTVCYMAPSISLDAECTPKNTSRLLWRQMVPALKCEPNPYLQYMWGKAARVFLNAICAVFLFVFPFSTYTAVREAKERIGSAVSTVASGSDVAFFERCIAELMTQKK